MRRRLRRLFCLLALLTLFSFAQGAAALADELEVHFISVGRNDAILIRCGGESAFIDSGTYRRGEESAAYLRAQGGRSVKYYIGSHAHLDHVGGAPVILANFDVGAIVQPHSGVREAIEASIKTEAERVALANTPDQNLLAGQQLRVGGATITCLGPLRVRPADIYSTDENDNSLVLLLSYGSKRFLLSADATAASLKAIEAASPGSLRADVYKNAHHNGTTAESLIAAIRPEWTLFSTDAKSMPSKAYLQTLSEYGSKALITAANHSGSVVMTTDGTSIRVRTEYRANSLTLNRSALSLYAGQSETLKATVKPSGRYRTVTYISDNPSVATVSGSGKVTGVSPGVATIRAMEPSGPSAVCRVTVAAQTLTLKKTAVSVRQGKSTSVSWAVAPSGGRKATLIWSSADETVARVTQKGKIVGVYPGTTTVSATMPGGQSSSVQVTVTPVEVSSVRLSRSKLSLQIGQSSAMKAKISPSGATWKDVTWSVLDERVATVTQDGVVTAVAPGTTTLLATARNGKSGKAKITVKPLYVRKIALSPAPTGLVAGVAGRNQAQLLYAVEPDDATIRQVKWSSSNSKVVSVDESGLLTAHKAGTATITCKATDGSRKSARVKVRVAANELNAKPVALPGQLTVAPKRMRYVASGLEITMAFANRTGVKQTVNAQGVLTVTLPDGTQIPALSIGGRALTIANRATKTLTFIVPVGDARLSGLDLSRCSAVIRGGRANAAGSGKCRAVRAARQPKGLHRRSRIRVLRAARLTPTMRWQE